ncbi:unnamed protein product [Schistosoma haematobium]|nr:unnamed protein product [Schistosoma haematobium]CAH8561370.1 unnamed protein product [Schistosoma haematobium]
MTRFGGSDFVDVHCFNLVLVLPPVVIGCLIKYCPTHCHSYFTKIQHTSMLDPNLLKAGLYIYKKQLVVCTVRLCSVL